MNNRTSSPARRLVAVAGAALVSLSCLAGASFAAGGTTSLLARVRISNGDAPFRGDRPLLTTVTPNGDGTRDSAIVGFRLTRPARVIVRVFKPIGRAAPPQPIWQSAADFTAGRHQVAWRPDAATEARAYVVHVTAVDSRGRRQTVGRLRRGEIQTPAGPVVHVVEVDAGFTHQSYAPGAHAKLVVSTDAPALELQFFRAGPESSPSIYAYPQNVLHGVAAGGARNLKWADHRDAPRVLTLRVPHGPSGLYFARLTAPDGRVGFAPFVLLPRYLGRHRVAVVFPTNTWAAYNHRDDDGDGWGDTWYAVNAINCLNIQRPYLHRGVPTRFRAYELGFVRWLYAHHKKVDFISDAQLDRVPGTRLARLYDLVVFLGHHEYMTSAAYDHVRGYRDRGGNLLFTSATNFLWRVERRGHWLIRTHMWRDRRPEASLIGVQYLHNDGGAHQGHYRVSASKAARWAFRGTGLRPGDTFGHGGIEIDARSKASPKNVIVLASMPNLHGSGLSAEMTYYETPAGARVFAAGTLNFAGTASEPNVSPVLENVWRRLARP